MGLVGWRFSQHAVFYLVPLFAAVTSLVVLSIPRHAIDHERARGGLSGYNTADVHSSGWNVLAARKPLLVLAGAAALFHFANASMLPLLGQRPALAHSSRAPDRDGGGPPGTQAAAADWRCGFSLHGPLCAVLDNPLWLVAAQVLTL